MTKPKIKPAENSKSKGRTYSSLLGNYKKAIREGYYGEAELIVYAYMEDRLKSFIYYCDGLENMKLNNNVSDKVKSIFPNFDNVKDISLKCKLIKKLLNLSEKDQYKTEYSIEISKIVRANIDVKGFKKEITNIFAWCDYRNEHVHAMFNKDLEDLRNNYKAHVEEGYRIARYIDKQVELIKNA